LTGYWAIGCGTNLNARSAFSSADAMTECRVTSIESSDNCRTGLRRSLKLRDLLLYGLVLISPLAPMNVFGVLTERGRGHVVTAVLLGFVAMLFTSISYGRMAQAYPSAGSAFTYVAREIHPGLGYVTGWAMLMDYIVCPIVCITWIAQQSHIFVPSLPVASWIVLYVGATTWLNVQSIKSSARFNIVMAAVMSAVVVVFLAAAFHYIAKQPHTDPAFFTRPFYDPHTFSFGGLFGSTSIAVLIYLGFDGISTLSEETENPERNVLLATVLTCIVTGLVSAVEVYVGQLVWPASEHFPDLDTAYVWVAGRVWHPMFTVIGMSLLLVYFCCAMAAHLGASRLLYGMGRSNAIPRNFFGAVDPKHHVPRNNVILVAGVVLVGSLCLNFDLAAQLQNFGALIAFVGVNAAAFLRYFVHAPQKKIWNFAWPVAGFLICLLLWWTLGWPAKIVGLAWMFIGIAYGLWSTRGFRLPYSFAVSEQEP
jgi:putrescine importer